MDIFKKIGKVSGQIGGFAVGVTIGIMEGVVELVKTEGNWEKVRKKMDERLDSCILEGGKIGEQCEGIVEVVLTTVVTYYVDKTLKGRKHEEKKH
jgi:hypothetical protein